MWMLRRPSNPWASEFFYADGSTSPIEVYRRREQAIAAGTPGSDIKLILVRNPTAWSPGQAFGYAVGAPYHVDRDVPLNALPNLDACFESGPKFWRTAGLEGGEDLVRALNWLGTEGPVQANTDGIRGGVLIGFDGRVQLQCGRWSPGTATAHLCEKRLVLGAGGCRQAARCLIERQWSSSSS
jgi:hypothetical protein